MKWTGYPYIVHGINNRLRKKYRHKCPSMEEAARTKKSREFNYYGTAFMITIDTYMVSNTCIHTKSVYKIGVYKSYLLLLSPLGDHKGRETKIWNPHKIYILWVCIFVTNFIIADLIALCSEYRYVINVDVPQNINHRTCHAKALSAAHLCMCMYLYYILWMGTLRKYYKRAIWLPKTQKWSYFYNNFRTLC